MSPKRPGDHASARAGRDASRGDRARAGTRPSRPPKPRLVKVLVQPVFLLDHGTHLEEVEHPTVAVPPDEWPTYSGERFPRELADWERQLREDAKPSRVDGGHAGRKAKP